MIDMTDTIKPKSDQLNADDLIGGVTKTIKISKIAIVNDKQQPVAVYFDGDGGKPYKPCLSMRRVLIDAWGTDGAKYVGRMMTIVRDPSVVYGGVKVGGIRITHLSHIDGDRQIALTATRGVRKLYTVKALAVGAMPEISDELRDEGLFAANNGVEAYKAWLAKLSPEVKQVIKPYHAEWSGIAKEADARAVQEISPSHNEATAEADSDFPGDR